MKTTTALGRGKALHCQCGCKLLWTWLVSQTIPCGGEQNANIYGCVPRPSLFFLPSLLTFCNLFLYPLCFTVKSITLCHDWQLE
jgi:hypothetical protein